MNIPASIHSRILAAAALFALAAVPAVAGRYELVKGQGVEVCEAYGRSLNISHPKASMICERSVESAGFSKPVWQVLNLQETARLVVQRDIQITAKIVPGGVVNKSLSERIEMAANNIREGNESGGWPLKMELAVMDIDNDGKTEKVLKERLGDCPNQRAFSVDLTVLTEDGKYYDLERSKLINPDVSKAVANIQKEVNDKNIHLRSAGIVRDELGYLLYDAFLYKGVAYTDLWEMGKNRLHVFLTKQNSTQNICIYQLNRTIN